jgi:hypothetical protein
MATKKTTKATSPAKRNPDAFEVVKSGDTTSQALAKLATTSVLSAVTLKRYSGAGDALEVPDLVTEMRKAGDEVVEGNMGRVERMLANQAMTLDAIFNDMAQRSGRQDTYKGIEVLMRLALKAQAQARSTAEALALLKNPMPFIKQANLTTGPQQVNNTYAGGTLERSARAQAGAGNSQSEPNKLLEADHGQRLDIGAQAAAGRANQKLETVG